MSFAERKSKADSQGLSTFMDVRIFFLTMWCSLRRRFGCRSLPCADEQYLLCDTAFWLIDQWISRSHKCKGSNRFYCMSLDPRFINFKVSTFKHFASPAPVIRVAVAVVRPAITVVVVIILSCSACLFRGICMTILWWVQRVQTVLTTGSFIIFLLGWSKNFWKGSANVRAFKGYYAEACQLQKRY